ncbi:voltage-dependent calcium channel gamma-7 subunit-like [Apostichopus japonicus]|uniref:voltage-dependent calcium channel gamma-7 subunit-like n=1 Tax=Stichopus japonicus TaxID=307972 RepID=UPI003AB56DB9
MENRKLLALTIWTVVGSYVAFLMMCTATFTNQWIYTREVMKTINDTGTEVREIRQHSGLLVACQMVDNISWSPHEGESSSWDTPFTENKCTKLRELLSDREDPPNTITYAVFLHTSKLFFLPLFTCLLLLSAVIVCTVAQFMPKRRCMVFLSGTICVICGLTSLTAIVRYIIAINDAIIEKHSQSKDITFEHKYRLSFILAVITFMQANAVGVASLYLFILLEKQAAHSEKERVRHHLQRLGMNVIHGPNNEVETAFISPGAGGEVYGVPVMSWKETQYGFEGDPNWKDERNQAEL